MTTIQPSAVKNDVKNYWDSHPCGTQFTDLAWGSKEFFDEVERFRYEIHPFLHRAIGFQNYAQKSVLEIGCGLGTDLVQFARAGAIVTGVDLTPQSIELAKKRLSLSGLKGRVQVADAENLPFSDRAFDVVYSFGVLHHTPDTQRAVSEAHRVLKPGGEAVIMLYHKTSLHVLLGIPLFALYRIVSSKNLKTGGVFEDWIRVYDGSGNPLGKAYSKGEVRKMFRQFRSVRFDVFDPIRRRFPSFLNQINQRLFAPWLGFYLVIRATK